LRAGASGVDFETPGFLKKPGVCSTLSRVSCHLIFCLIITRIFLILLSVILVKKMLIDRGEKMHIASFETQVLPDGHLFCPEEFRNKQNIRFVVLLIEDKEGVAASDHDIEMASVHDVSNDFLSQKELNYYMNLEEL